MKRVRCIMWASIPPDGDLAVFRTRREAIDHPTICVGINDKQCTWAEAKAAGWRVAKVRVEEASAM